MAKKVKWEAADYTPYFLYDAPMHTEREIRAEYTRIRDIVMKRANRLESIAPRQAEKLRKMMPKLSEIKPEQVGMQLAGAKAFYDNPLATKKGIIAEKQRIKKETGTDVPLSEILDFNDYMQSWRLGSFSSLVAASDAADYHRTDIYQEYGGTFDTFFRLYLKSQGIDVVETGKAE